jgi:hypothetical protein
MLGLGTCKDAAREVVEVLGIVGFLLGDTGISSPMSSSESWMTRALLGRLEDLGLDVAGSGDSGAGAPIESGEDVISNARLGVRPSSFPSPREVNTLFGVSRLSSSRTNPSLLRGCEVDSSKFASCTICKRFPARRELGVRELEGLSGALLVAG